WGEAEVGRKGRRGGGGGAPAVTSAGPRAPAALRGDGAAYGRARGRGRGSRSGTPAAAAVALALALLLAHSRFHRPQPRLQLVAARARGAPAGRAQQLACLRLLPVLGEQRHLRDARLVPGGAARWARVEDAPP